MKSRILKRLIFSSLVGSTLIGGAFLNTGAAHADDPNSDEIASTSYAQYPASQDGSVPVTFKDPQNGDEMTPFTFNNDGSIHYLTEQEYLDSQSNVETESDTPYSDSTQESGTDSLSDQKDVPEAISYSYKETSTTNYTGKPRRVTAWSTGPGTVTHSISYNSSIDTYFSVEGSAEQSAVKSGASISLQSGKAVSNSYDLKIKSGHTGAMFFYPSMRKTTGTLTGKSETYGYTTRKKVTARGPVLLDSGEADGIYKIDYKD